MFSIKLTSWHSLYSELIDEKVKDWRETAKWLAKKTESKGIIKLPVNFTLFQTECVSVLPTISIPPYAKEHKRWQVLSQ